MSSKPIIIVCGEPQSVFFEIFLKTIKKLNIKRFKNPLLLITSNSILYENFKKFKINFKTNYIDEKLINLKKDELNIINHIKYPLIFIFKQIGILIPFWFLLWLLINKIPKKITLFGKYY